MTLWKDENGQAVILVAVILAVVSVGFLAVAADAGLLFRQKRLAQSAADAAALAAAGEAAAGNSGNEQAVANAVVTLNGLNTSAASNPATVTLTTPSSGSFTGSAYVQATVTAPTHTYILSAFNSSFSEVPVQAVAIAGGGNSSTTCVCLEAPTGNALNLSNGSSLSASTCGVVDDSSSSNAVSIVGGAKLNALSLGTVSSTWDNSNNINNGGSITSTTKVIQGVTNTCAPAMPPVPTYSSCLSDPGGSSTSFTAGPASAGGVICYKSLTVGANGTLDTLNPGIYVISSGALHFESGKNGVSNAGGNGVFFYLVGSASLVIDNGANVNLVAGGSAQAGGGTATSTGVYDGILMYQDTSDKAAVSAQGGANTFMNGSLLAPSAALTLGNGSSSTIEGSIVAQTLTMNGGGVLTPTPSSSEGSMIISSPKMAQ